MDSFFLKSLATYCWLWHTGLLCEVWTFAHMFCFPFIQVFSQILLLVALEKKQYKDGFFFVKHISNCNTCIHPERCHRDVFLVDFDVPLFSDPAHHTQNDSLAVRHSRSECIVHFDHAQELFAQLRSPVPWISQTNIRAPDTLHVISRWSELAAHSVPTKFINFFYGLFTNILLDLILLFLKKTFFSFFPFKQLQKIVHNKKIGNNYAENITLLRNNYASPFCFNPCGGVLSAVFDLKFCPLFFIILFQI